MSQAGQGLPDVIITLYQDFFVFDQHFISIEAILIDSLLLIITEIHYNCR